MNSCVKSHYGPTRSRLPHALDPYRHGRPAHITWNAVVQLFFNDPNACGKVPRTRACCPPRGYLGASHGSWRWCGSQSTSTVVHAFVFRAHQRHVLGQHRFIAPRVEVSKFRSLPTYGAAGTQDKKKASERADVVQRHFSWVIQSVHFR
ncbi:hypothetical protein B296_00033896 [Ensete ventricosum]|uniref:Uncharacterized protein n=1 Tax=Ensete ventricosum TaxID=4639 RepID=A0A427A3H9_ENSVE|nr:hypothetical protein B296_00033896 [Ensete ventricosum]